MRTWIIVALAASLLGGCTVFQTSAQFPSSEMRWLTWIYSMGHQLRLHQPVDRKTFLTTERPNLPPDRAALQANTVSTEMVGGYPVYRLRARQGVSGQVLVYLHGGGFVAPLDQSHWNVIHQLRQVSGVDILVPLYPLAPNTTAATTASFLEQVYRRLLQQHQAHDITFMGDSAGGALVLTQVLRYRDLGLPLPARLILVYPWLDLSLTDPQAQALESRDVVLTVEALRTFGQWWAGEDSPRSPEVSPLYADPRGLPELLIFQGSDDILRTDVERFLGRLSQAAVRFDYRPLPDAFHGFLSHGHLPETRYVFDTIRQFLHGTGQTESESK